LLLLHIAKNFFISIPLHYTEHIYSDVFVDVFRLYDPGDGDDGDNDNSDDDGDDGGGDENTMFNMMMIMMIIMRKIMIINSFICVLDVKKSSVSISSKLLSMMKAFQSGMDEEEMRYRSSDKAMLIGLYHEEV